MFHPSDCVTNSARSTLVKQPRLTSIRSCTQFSVLSKVGFPVEYGHDTAGGILSIHPSFPLHIVPDLQAPGHSSRPRTCYCPKPDLAFLCHIHDETYPTFVGISYVGLGDISSVII